jgi:hypothetical protein
LAKPGRVDRSFRTDARAKPARPDDRHRKRRLEWLPDELGDVEDDLHPARVVARTNLACDRADDVVQPPVALLAREVRRARDDLAPVFGVGAPLAVVVEHDVGAVVRRGSGT